MTTKEYLESAIKRLETCPIKQWAELWVELRLEFHRKYHNGIVFSTEFGANFFENVYEHLVTKTYLYDKDSEYNHNFNVWLKKQIV